MGGAGLGMIRVHSYSLRDTNEGYDGTILRLMITCPQLIQLHDPTVMIFVEPAIPRAVGSLFIIDQVIMSMHLSRCRPFPSIDISTHMDKRCEA